MIAPPALLLPLLALLPAAGGARHEGKVFGLGPGRTGTDSLKLALEALGFGPTYHMKEALFEEAGISTAGHFATWQRAGNGEEVDWEDFLRDWPSGCDYPLSAFPEELLAAFPTAKFVLTTRPAAKWYASIADTICQMHGTWFMSTVKRLPFFPFSRFLEQTPAIDAITRNKFTPGVDEVQTWQDVCGSEELAVSAFEAWNARVKALIPPSQLLVFELGRDGYAELADFLGAEPPPGADYPRSNASAEFGKIVLGMQCVAVAVYALPLTALALAARWALRGRRKGAKAD